MNLMDSDGAKNAIIAAIPAQYRDTYIAYLVTLPYTPGDTLLIDGRSHKFNHPAFLGFIDLQAGRNWAHPCLYIIHADSGTEVFPGTIPPDVGRERKLLVIAAGPKAPEWAISPTHDRDG